MMNWIDMVSCTDEEYQDLHQELKSCSGMYIFDDITMPDTFDNCLLTIMFSYYGEDRIDLSYEGATPMYHGSSGEISRWVSSKNATFSSFEELKTFLKSFACDTPILGGAPDPLNGGETPPPPFEAPDNDFSGLILPQLDNPETASSHSNDSFFSSAPARAPEEAPAPAPVAASTPSPSSTFDRDQVTVPQVDNSVIKIDRDRLTLDLNSEIFGQEDSIDKIVHLVCNFLASKGKRRPLSIFLYGPPGTGKSETVKLLVDKINAQLSERPNSPMLTYKDLDCSHCKTAEDITRVIGAPPGYVGFEEKGVFAGLTDNKYGVFVLEEITRAHPSIAEALMIALETGRMATNGRTLKDGNNYYDLSHSIIFFTSNIDLESSSDSLYAPAPTDSIGVKVLKETNLAKVKLLESGAFDRAVISRMHAIMEFKVLKGDALKDVAAKCICDTFRTMGHLVVDHVDTPLFQQFLDYTANDIANFGVRTLRTASECCFTEPVVNFAADSEDYVHVNVSGTLDNVIITAA